MDSRLDLKFLKTTLVGLLGIVSMCSVGNSFAQSNNFISSPDLNKLYNKPNLNNVISLKFQNADTRVILQLLAKKAGLNFVISDSVKGNMSIQLDRVHWKQAFDIVLKINGLSYRSFKGAWLIAPLDELTNIKVRELQAEQKLANLEPARSQIVKLHYANATNIANILKGSDSKLLSDKGQVGVDIRTNSLWIKDTPTYLREVRRLIRQLDVSAPQIQLEARIVTIDKSFLKELGVRWGITNPKHLSGTLKGANQLVKNFRDTSITSRLGEAVEVPLTDRLNFDLPATTLFSNPATAGVALAQIGKVFVDLELSALESEGVAKVVSAPHLITENQHTAYVQSGEEIPYQESSSSGATSISFKKAVLGLEVTPQIAAGNRVILNIKVSQNKRGEQLQTNTGTQLPPAIDTEEIKSDVLLKSGETVIIGGVYKHTEDNDVERIPILGRIPLIGYFFRHKAKQDIQDELLVFLTPKIINNMPKSRDDIPYYHEQKKKKEKEMLDKIKKNATKGGEK